MTVRIINGDCLDVLARMRAASVDLVFSSPPYNIGKEYELARDLEDYGNWIVPILSECVRILRSGGSLCWQVGNHITGTGRTREVMPLDYFFAPLFLERGLVYRHRVIWSFGHGLHNRHSFSGRHECIMWFTKGGYPRLDGAVERLGYCWDVTNVKHNHPEKTAHPCQFPEVLVTRFIEEVTQPGALVVDPFAGSGTVGVAAARLNRRAWLIELDAGYCAIAASRLASFRSDRCAA